MAYGRPKPQTSRLASILTMSAVLVVAPLRRLVMGRR